MSFSRVVLIRGKGVLGPDGEMSAAKASEMLERGFKLLTETSDARDACSRLFNPGDRVGIKINTIGGRRISTRPELSLALAGLLAKGRHPEKNVVIWDRTNRELREAGYRLSDNPSGFKVFGTDTTGAGYGSELVSHRHIGSLFSSIQANFVTASISLAILKDHGLAGVTAGMKNYFGAVHNPNKYHDSRCNPFIAELFDSPPVRDKHRLTILDALLVQYHRGPSFHPQWAERAGSLVFSRDPVASDIVGWQILERLRSQKGLPTLRQEDREPVYLRTAEGMGLGCANLAGIQIIEDEV
ncbi:MAG: DUF362 domain-containing protein [Acidobacteriota bacterium]